ncbi:Isoleucine--tRNA ligase [Labeo rohita]|uniref:Isoleucine--tRNA ligase n=1 Tax=Labeo rohita TaxID=84645 RepID=A0ABQ8L162_LABRO|nr:Isoleucine--tRNA ligase [Labeo rohita]
MRQRGSPSLYMSCGTGKNRGGGEAARDLRSPSPTSALIAQILPNYDDFRYEKPGNVRKVHIHEMNRAHEIVPPSSNGIAGKRMSLVCAAISFPQLRMTSADVHTPDQEVLVYALLNTQSDTTFILGEVAQELNTKKENVSLQLSTMSAKATVIPCQKLTNLQVRGYNSEKRIPLPTVFTQKFIPANRSHIPTSETALKWPHLKQLADKIPPPLDCKLREGIRQKEGGHFEPPLPFKTDTPSLPDNKQCAVHRFTSLEQRLRRDKQSIRGDDERVPRSELENQPVWYIPHHRVYHPHKPGKICVVFDCSARFQETSLNDHLLTGPDLTNTLEHQDYLSFLWWDDGSLDSRPSVYRMKVHLFGAASSPGCSNFGLKYLVSQGQGKLSKESIKFIRRSFYVDDGLTSVMSSAEAIHLVREARALWKTGNLRLHKFVCNDEEVISTTPPEECAQTKDLDMALGELHIERGVLSTVASVYDPLGFVAPFLLVGKQILQKLCKDKVNWDEDVPERILPQWESWLRDLPHLAALKIPRSYLPSDFDEVVSYELHNFADASFTGYGACSLFIS